MSEPFWLTAFLDVPADRYDAALAFWSDVTGYRRSAPRGAHEEFVSLLPTDGDEYLRLQRVDDGESRVHLDVHVLDPAATAAEAEQLGAGVVADEGDYLTLRSPGGFAFCLVQQPASTRPRPTQWSPSLASYVDQVCLDIPPSRYDAEVGFWARLTGWQRLDPRPDSEFGRINPPPNLALQLLLQRLDDEEPMVRAHLDWSSTDREAEVARHVEAGAEHVGTFEGWTVLRDPAGAAYCVTRRSPDDGRPREA